MSFSEGKHVLMNRQRSSQVTHAQQPTPAKHICSLCGKSRSKRYYDQHPLRLDKIPDSGICSMPKYTKAVSEIMRPACRTHYHYPSTPGLEELPPSYTTEELQLPDNTLLSSRQSTWDPSPIREWSSPLVNLTAGTEETPLSYTAAELSGESSLNGRVELPDNSCSRRRTFRKLSPIQEESPPVNFLKKPTPWKKNQGTWEN